MRSIVLKHQLVAFAIDDDGMLTVNFLRQNVFRKLIEHHTLDGTLYWPRTEFRVITVFRKKTEGGRGYAEFHSFCSLHPTYGLDLKFNYFLYFLLFERSEHHYLVNTIEEFRADGLFQKVNDILFGLLYRLLTV